MNWLRFVILSPGRSAASSFKVPSIDLGGPIAITRDCNRRNRMGPAPKACCNGQGIDPLALPPRALIAAPVQVTMVQSANGHGKPVADLAPHGALLRKFDVVGI
jgi:hypothetical protein